MLGRDPIIHPSAVASQQPAGKVEQSFHVTVQGLAIGDNAIGKRLAPSARLAGSAIERSTARLENETLNSADKKRRIPRAASPLGETCRHQRHSTATLPPTPTLSGVVRQPFFADGFFHDPRQTKTLSTREAQG
jgi:hypothetical protein